MGFYPIPGYNYTPLRCTYRQKLQDPRWIKKTKLVKELAGWKCQDCGKSDRLETHHCYYTVMREGNEPWEYPLSALRCLCHSCHRTRSKAESRMRAYMAKLTTTQIDSLRESLDRAFYWFESGAVIELLAKLGHSDEKIMLAFTELLRWRNETD